MHSIIKKYWDIVAFDNIPISFNAQIVFNQNLKCLTVCAPVMSFLSESMPIFRC